MAKPTPHPDVKVRERKRDGRKFWTARYRHPETGERVEEYFSKLKLHTEAQREAWAMKKQAEILAAVHGLTPKGQPIPPEPVQSVTVEKAFELFFGRREGDLAEKTIQGYQTSAKVFRSWCDDHGIERLDQLTPAVLDEFRDDAARMNAYTSAKEEKSGVKTESTRRLSRASVNKLLSHVRIFLKKWCRMELVDLRWDRVSDTLKKTREEKTNPVYLRPAQVRQLLRACIAHDEKTHDMTRKEKAKGIRGKTPKFPPIAPYMLAMVLSGARAREMSELSWAEVDPEDGIHLDPARVKTRHARIVTYKESPKLKELLKALGENRGDATHVFGPGWTPLTLPTVQAARKRLLSDFKAPTFDYPTLRKTCGTYLTCAPAIYEGASAFLSAKRLGHSVTIAEKHYVGVVSDIPKNQHTLDAVFGIDVLADKIISMVKARNPARG